MKSRFLVMLLAATAAFSPLRAATDGEVEARRVALDLAGAFANDGFKLRDGVWIGTLEPGKAKLVQVNLFTGNEYWFSLGATAPAKKLKVTVYDETGVSIDSETYDGEGSVTAAAGFSPDASGPYYVKVELLEGEAAPYCLVYSYK